MGQLQLSKRLSCVAGMVTEGNRLVDVGCDHAYLPVHLVLSKRIPSAIAADVKKGPLSRAREHIREYGLEDRIQTRLSDGLSNIHQGEGDTLVMAGMGGPLMERILTEGERVAGSFREMVLSPQSEAARFRRFLLSSGWVITGEDLVEEEGKYYPVIKACHREEFPQCPTVYSPEEEWFGKLLLDGAHPVLFRYLLREESLRREIRAHLLEKPGENSRRRLEEIEEERRLIKAALKRYEGKGFDRPAGDPLSPGGGGGLG